MMTLMPQASACLNMRSGSPDEGDNFLFRKNASHCRGLQLLLHGCPVGFEPMIMEITGLVIIFPFFDTVLGVGRSKPSVSIPKL